MSKLIITIAGILLLATNLFGQNNVNRHSISFELGGRGLIYSINYEYKFVDDFVVSAGISFFHLMESETDKSSELMSFPISIGYLLELGEGHYTEFGLGIMNLINTGDLVEYSGNTDYFMNPTVSVGYRYQPQDSRWIFKALATPFLGTKSPTNNEGTAFQPLGSVFQIWGGLSVGYSI